MVISITKAEMGNDLKIHFEFSDGTRRNIDFRPFLERSRNPMTRKYLDPVEFKNFQLEHGDIVWNDYELCFPIWNLYEGKL